MNIYTEPYVDAMVKNALNVYYDFNNMDPKKLYNIAGKTFKYKELEPLKDDIEKFILYTIYFSQFNIPFKFMIKAMYKYGILNFYKDNVKEVCPDKIDMELIKKFDLNNITIRNEEIQKELEEDKEYEEENDDDFYVTKREKIKEN